MSVEIGTLVVVGTMVAGLLAAAMGTLFGMPFGLGFLGGGAILKLESEQEIQGLTTAASIWMTAAIGLAAGLGRIGLAIISVTLTWIILSILVKIEQRITEIPEVRNEDN